MSNKYACKDLVDGFKKIQEKGGSEDFAKFLNSIEIPYRELYLNAFGNRADATIKDDYKDKLFRVEYENGTTYDVGKLISGGFRRYSYTTMFYFKFENENGNTIIDTEYQQPKILIIEKEK